MSALSLGVLVTRCGDAMADDDAATSEGNCIICCSCVAADGRRRVRLRSNTFGP